MPARKRQPSKRKAEAPAKETDDKKKEKRGKLTEPANRYGNFLSLSGKLNTLKTSVFNSSCLHSSEYPDAVLE